MEKFKMELLKEELYHYGVRGMKWRHRKASGSALAKQHRAYGVANLDSSQEIASSRGTEYGSKHPSGLSGEDRLWIKKQNKRNAQRQTTARAIERKKGAAKYVNGSRPKSPGADVYDGTGLYRRGKVSGTTARRSSKSSRGLQSASYDKTRSRAKKARVTKFVKRVLQ